MKFDAFPFLWQRAFRASRAPCSIIGLKALPTKDYWILVLAWPDRSQQILLLSKLDFSKLKEFSRLFEPTFYFNNSGDLRQAVVGSVERLRELPADFLVSADALSIAEKDYCFMGKELRPFLFAACVLPTLLIVGRPRD